MDLQSKDKCRGGLSWKLISNLREAVEPRSTRSLTSKFKGHFSLNVILCKGKDRRWSLCSVWRKSLKQWSLPPPSLLHQSTKVRAWPSALSVKLDGTCTSLLSYLVVWKWPITTLNHPWNQLPVILLQTTLNDRPYRNFAPFCGQQCVVRKWVRFWWWVEEVRNWVEQNGRQQNGADRETGQFTAVGDGL